MSGKVQSCSRLADFKGTHYAPLFIHLKDYQAALKHAKLALAQNPHNESALALAGFAAQLNGKFQDGIDYFTAKISRNPWDAHLYLSYAEMIALQQDLHKAIEALQKGLEIDPASIVLHTVIAQYYHRTGQTEKSEQHLDLIESIRYSMKRDQ